MKKAMNGGDDPRQFLQRNDSYHFFSHANALIKTGATQTNVMDVMFALVH
jgi:hydroxypyruvate reductase